MDLSLGIVWFEDMSLVVVAWLCYTLAEGIV